jgi:hypothetical protein
MRSPKRMLVTAVLAALALPVAVAPPASAAPADFRVLPYLQSPSS